MRRLVAEACMFLTCLMALWQGLGALCAVSPLRGPTRARGCDGRAPGLASFEVFLCLLALRGVTVLITRVRLLHFDKDYTYTASPSNPGLCHPTHAFGWLELHPTPPARTSPLAIPP